MSKTALITGATAGLGAEFARQLAAQGYSLVLVARDADRLRAKAEELECANGILCEVLTADLVSEPGLSAVVSRLADTSHPIDLLINNAGFGLTAPFDQNTVVDEQRHLDLLVAVPMKLTHAALGPMLARRAGTIINIASVAGFTPRGTYGAAKAWVLSFSRWANIHYAGRGVTVTAVAPGFVHTEFHARMNARTDNIPNLMWLTPGLVVSSALKAAARGKAVCVPSLRYKIVVWLTSWLPKRVIAVGALRGR